MPPQEIIKIVENCAIFGVNVMVFALIRQFALPTISAINNVARELGALRAVVESWDRRNAAKKEEKE